MSNQNEEYLTSLLQWGNDVEKMIEEAHLPDEKYEKWDRKMKVWKAKIKRVLDSNEDPAHEEVYKLQEEGRELVFDLEDYFETNRGENSITLGKHKLPPLPYAYDALEPYISEEIMKLHHLKHHQSYVDGLNKAEVKIYKNKNNDELLKHWMREQAFNGSGHYLHTIFWYNMTPNGGGRPKNPLLKQINQDFGSFANFKSLFSKAAESVEGVGWAMLIWEPRAGRLGIQTAEKHQMFSLWDTIPLLVLDVWEHAYYLQYENKRSEYINNWWNVVNWSDVQNRFEKASKLKWKLF